MIMRYVGAEEEIVPQLGGRRVEPGAVVMVKDEIVAKELLHTARWVVGLEPPKPRRQKRRVEIKRPASKPAVTPIEKDKGVEND